MAVSRCHSCSSRDHANSFQAPARRCCQPSVRSMMIWTFNTVTVLTSTGCAALPSSSSAFIIPRPSYPEVPLAVSTRSQALFWRRNTTTINVNNDLNAKHYGMNTALHMATSSKELKVERHERRRQRMEGSLVQGGNSTDTALLDNTTSTTDAEISDAEAADSNDAILEQSGLVRLQRAAKAELERREQKKLEEAVTIDDGGENRNGPIQSGRSASTESSRNGKSKSNAADDSAALAKEEQTRRVITSSWIRKATKGPEEEEPPAIISLDQLNRNIDKRLNSRDTLWDSRSELPRVEGTVQPPVRDSMSSLLSYNHIRGDWRGHQSATTYNVAVVFGKPLVRDQITVEYSSRIRTLARLFKDNPLFRPSLICFTGCIAPGNHVSDADAGYIFFRHMCEAQGIDLEGVDVLIDSRSRDEAEAVYRVTEGVKEDYVPMWLDLAPSDQKGFDDMKKIAVHFSLVSTEYHLCNLNDVHHRSPRQSLLKPIEAMDMSDDSSGGRSGGTSIGAQQYGFSGRRQGVGGGNDIFYDDWGGDGDQYNPLRGRKYKSPKITQEEGIVETSWSFQYATYPFLYAQDEAVVFLGKCFLLAEELMPLLVNMKGVVEQEEFFQRDNYLMLASIRRSLVAKLERLHKSPGIKKALKRYQSTVNNRPLGDKGSAATRDIIVILEGALLSLGRCVDLVRPAGLLVSVVPGENWRKALRALQHSLNEIRSVCDPDRPLRPTEWGKLVDEEDAMLDIGFQRMQHFVLWKDKVQRLSAASDKQGEADDDDDAIFDDQDFDVFSSLLGDE